MPAVLTTASKLQCVHGGTVTVTASSSALTVGGRPVLVEADLTTAKITNCSNTDASAGEVQCVTVTSVATGASTTLTVAGQPAMLETASGLTNGSPPLPVMWKVVSAGQNLLGAS